MGGSMKVAITIKKGETIKQGTIILTKISNASYVFQRFLNIGWIILRAQKLADLN
jgi:hypothetical protein